MKDLQSFAQHPNVKAGERLLLASDQPPCLVVGGEKKAMGRPLPTQALINLLKASLPGEVMSQFGWGKELTPKLKVGDASLPMKITLKPDKSIIINIQLKPAPPAASSSPIAAPDLSEPAQKEEPPQPKTETPPPTPPKDEAPPKVEAPPAPEPQERVTTPDPEPPPLPEIPEDQEEQFQKLMDSLTGGDQIGLIYHAPGTDPGPIVAALKKLGYDPRPTDHMTACMEAIKYNSYPMLVMIMPADFRQNPLYLNYIEMNMESRRTQYSVLIAPGLTTADTMLAFSLSVNLTMAPEAVNAAAQHIEKGKTAWQRFVGGFHEFLEAAGRL